MKHAIKFLFILVLVFTLYLIYSIVSITWEQYQETKDWESISIQGQLKDVPPFLAKNYINLQDKEAVETWQEVNQILTTLSESKQMKSEDIPKYKQTLERSVKMQEAYGITSGTIAEQNEQLALYLELENTLRTAYDVPCADVLKSLTGQVYSANLDNSSPIQVTYLNRLKEVAKDYEEADEFMKKTLPTLGTLSEGVLMGSTDMDEESTDDFIKKVKEKNLDRFGFINDLLVKLKGDEWVKVLTHNQMIYDYKLWQDAKKELHSIKASDYVLVEDIKTYADALDADLETDVIKRDGYRVDKESEVVSISYNGETLTKDKYIKRGSPGIIVIVDAKYKKNKDKDKAKEETPIVATEAGEVIDASTEQVTEESTTEVNTEDRDLPPVVPTEDSVTTEEVITP